MHIYNLQSAPTIKMVYIKKAKLASFILKILFLGWFLFFFWLQTTKRTVPFLFVRGDGMILVSPPLRTA